MGKAEKTALLEAADLPRFFPGFRPDPAVEETTHERSLAGNRVLNYKYLGKPGSGTVILSRIETSRWNPVGTIHTPAIEAAVRRSMKKKGQIEVVPDPDFFSPSRHGFGEGARFNWFEVNGQRNGCMLIVQDGRRKLMTIELWGFRYQNSAFYNDLIAEAMKGFDHLPH